MGRLLIFYRNNRREQETKVNTRAIVNKALYAMLAVIIATGGFFAGPTGVVQAATDGDYSYSTSGSPLTATITGYTGSGGAIVIPDTLGGYAVTSIGWRALNYCNSLTSVTIGNGVTSIGEEAFYNCQNMTSLTIGNGVTSIDMKAFMGCYALATASFSGNAPTLGFEVFDSCASGFTIHYDSSKTGWTNPWYGYTTAGTAKTIAVNAGDGQSAAVGTAVTTPPSVIVKDASGSPVSGVSVTFAVASGGGSATGLTPTTNASGIATVGSWTLGPTVGSNTLTATSGTLTGSPLTFTATGTAGAVATVAVSGDASIVSGVESSGYTAVSKDAAGNIVSGDTYTWSRTNGTGTANITSTNKLTGVLVGTVTMTATSVLNAAISGGKSVTVTAGAVATVTVSGDASIVSGVESSGYTAVSKDAAGNIVSGDTYNWSETNGTGTASITSTNKLTGVLVGTVTMTATSVLNAAISGGKSVTVTAGTATHVNVETAADGSGSVVGEQSIASGSTVPAYAISRDASNNFVANVSGTWSMTNIMGGVTDTDLSPLTGASTTFTGHVAGTGVIHVTSGSLTAGDSETLTVTAGAAASLTVNQAPASTGTVDVIFTTQPWILVKDGSGNPVSGTVVTASLASGGGALRTTLTATSDANGLAKFTDLAYNKTDAFRLHFAAGALNVDATAFGPLLAGAATLVKVETLATGSGVVVPARDLASGSTLTVYSITRDQFGNFVSNAAATWSFASRTGDVADTDLVGGGASAVMTGRLVGSGVIHAAIVGLTPGDSGSIAVTTGAAASLTVNQAPASTGSVDVIFTTQPWILVKDAANNPVVGTVVTASPASGSGALRTTLTATSDANGLAKFTDLGYNRTDAFQLHFAAGALNVNAPAFGPLAAGTATAVRVETLSTGLGAVVPNQDLAYSSTLAVYSITRDQFGNFAANASADNWTLTDETGGVVDGDLVGGGASAVMTGHLVGSGVIHAPIAGLTSTDSGIITVIPNTATDILTFNFLTPAATGVVNNELHTVALTVPFGTNVTNLVPTITVSAGATVSPLSEVEQNFASPLSYTVTAADGITLQVYIVTVTVAPPPPPPPPPPANPLIGTGAPTAHGSSGTGTSPTATTQTVSLPNIQIQSASLSANKVAAGTPITVTADRINKSTVNGSKKITLYVNGQEETAQGITVNSGGTSKLTFYVTRSEPGDYSVYVDGVQAGSFKVETFRESDIILWLSMACVLAALILGAFMLWRRQRTDYN